MDKFLNILKQKVEDETAAFTILGAMIVTFGILIIIFECISYNRTVEVNGGVSLSQAEQKEQVSLENSENLVNENVIEVELDEEKAKEENEEEYEKLKEENKISSAADKYYIKVNYGAQVVTVYTKDSNGKYTKTVKAMVCSTGTYTPTSGTYRTLGKGNWWPLMGDVYGQYSTWICGDILFHSVPYLEKGDKSSLEYWAYDQLGQRVSMGCVRLTTADALWIYNNCAIGTQVEFYSSSNPGPLGKPSAKKISNAPSNVRGWDPTDPDSRNPWPEYLRELENQKEEEENKNNNKNEENSKNEVVNEIENTTSNNNENVNTTGNVVENNDIMQGNNEVNNNTVDNNIQGNNETNNDTETNESNQTNNINDTGQLEEKNVYVSEIV